MLTVHNMFTKFTEPTSQPTGLVTDHDIWFPITKLVEAYMVMQAEGEALS